MSDADALKILEEFIESWTTVNNRFSKQINAHSFVIGETEIEAMKICATRLAMSEEKTKKKKVTVSCSATYKNEKVKVIRGAFPRFGQQRVVIERQSDKRKFTVGVNYLTVIDSEVQENNE